MAPTENKLWFPAKKYGYGWGFPNCWQGWLVIAGYYVLVVAGALLILIQRKSVPAFLAYVGIVTVALILICRWKGERPRWRWGKE